MRTKQMVAETLATICVTYNNVRTVKLHIKITYYFSCTYAPQTHNFKIWG